MIIAKNSRVISESCTVPEIGSIKRVGNTTTFTMTMTFSSEKISDMQNAKAFFFLHRERMQRILSRYCDLIGQVSKTGNNLGLPGAGGGIVKAILTRLGYLDED